jgi:hypothetical protein
MPTAYLIQKTGKGEGMFINTTSNKPRALF